MKAKEKTYSEVDVQRAVAFALRQITDKHHISLTDEDVSWRAMKALEYAHKHKGTKVYTYSKSWTIEE